MTHLSLWHNFVFLKDGRTPIAGRTNGGGRTDSYPAGPVCFGNLAQKLTYRNQKLSCCNDSKLPYQVTGNYYLQQNRHQGYF